MIPAILFDDPDLWACHLLRSQLDASVYVGRSLPPGGPDPRSVVVQAAGGSRVDSVTRLVRFSVRVWAPTDVEANSLSERVAAAFTAAPKGARVSVPVAVDNPSPLRHFTAETRLRGASFSRP